MIWRCSSGRLPHHSKTRVLRAEPLSSSTPLGIQGTVVAARCPGLNDQSCLLDVCAVPHCQYQSTPKLREEPSQGTLLICLQSLWVRNSRGLISRIALFSLVTSWPSLRGSNGWRQPGSRLLSHLEAFHMSRP